MHTDKNPNKRGTQHQLRQRRCAMDMFYLKKNIIVEETLVPQKASKFGGFVKKVKKAHVFMNFSKFTALHDNTFYRYILFRTFLSVL